MEKSKVIMCPRCGKYPAWIDKVYGVLPCKESCQAKDAGFKIIRPSDGYSLARSHRVQKARDRFAKDTVQPYKSGKPNPDYFKIHPDQVGKYGVKKELEKI